MLRNIDCHLYQSHKQKTKKYTNLAWHWATTPNNIDMTNYTNNQIPNAGTTTKHVHEMVEKLINIYSMTTTLGICQD